MTRNNQFLRWTKSQGNRSTGQFLLFPTTISYFFFPPLKRVEVSSLRLDPLLGRLNFLYLTEKKKNETKIQTVAKDKLISRIGTLNSVAFCQL